MNCDVLMDKMVFELGCNTIYVYGNIGDEAGKLLKLEMWNKCKDE